MEHNLQIGDICPFCWMLKTWNKQQNRERRSSLVILKILLRMPQFGITISRCSQIYNATIPQKIYFPYKFEKYGLGQSYLIFVHIGTPPHYLDL